MESLRFLIAYQADAPATREILHKLKVSAQAAATRLVDVAKSNPVQQLFTGGLAFTTALVWIAFFANLLNMYLFSYWMPTLLSLSGLKPEIAVFYASMFSLGGILSCLLLGPMIDRCGPPKVLACSFASGVVFILIIGLSNPPAPFIATPILCAGAAMIGSQLGHGCRALSGAHPLNRRRLGARCRPARRYCGIAIGGTLLGFGFPLRQIFLCACAPALVAATCTFLLRVKSARNRDYRNAGAGAASADANRR